MREDNIKKYRWVKGQSGNPAGRPKGSISPKDKIRQMFEANEDSFEEWLEAYIEDPKNRQHVVEMLDGKPKQSVDMEVSLPESLIELIKHGTSNTGRSEEISGTN